MTIKYLNTDLDLKCPHDLRPLTSDFEARGVWILHVDQEEDGHWFACLEHNGVDQPEPETTITSILEVIESSSEVVKRIWNACTMREFNIGYECGTEPWAFNQGISNDILLRLAQSGATLRITLYPPMPAHPEECNET